MAIDTDVVANRLKGGATPRKESDPSRFYVTWSCKPDDEEGLAYIAAVRSMYKAIGGIDALTGLILQAYREMYPDAE